MKRRAVLVALFVLIVIFGGSFVFMYIEGRTFLESLYFVIATVTTVGYGDVVASTEAGMLLSIVLIVFGAGAVLSIIPLLFSYLVEKDIRSALGFEKLPKLSEHIIICGYNELAEQALEEISARKIPYIIIEDDEDRIGRLRDLKILHINGNPGEEWVLKKAMIEDATSIILASRNESDNTFIAMAARELNPGIKIIARAESSETVPIFKSVGIDVIIEPQVITLKTLVKNALSPYAEALLDEVSLFKNVNMGQFQVSQESPVSGKKILDVKFRDETGASIVAIWRGSEMYPNPPSDTVIHENDVLLVLGTSKQLQTAKAFVEGAGLRRELKELAEDVEKERIVRMEAASEIRGRLPKVLINLMVVLGLFFAVTVVMPSFIAIMQLIPHVGPSLGAILLLTTWILIALIVFRMLEDTSILLGVLSETLTGLFPGTPRKGVLNRVLRDVAFAVIIVMFFAVVSRMAANAATSLKTVLSILSVALPAFFLYDAARVLSENVKFLVDRVAEKVAGEIEKEEKG